jgi:hypothetical protein
MRFLNLLIPLKGLFRGTFRNAVSFTLTNVKVSTYKYHRSHLTLSVSKMHSFYISNTHMPLNSKHQINSQIISGKTTY